MAATELRPRVCAAVVIPTVVVYLTAAIATQDANAEPWASITLGTCVLAGVEQAASACRPSRGPG